MLALKAYLLALLTALSLAVSAASPASLKETTVTIAADGKVLCTGAAVGKHTVATATHCLVRPAGDLKFNGVGCKGDRVFAHDGTDNVLISTCATFKRWTKISTHTPKPGDKVQQWGWPLGLALLYREGVMAGSMPDKWFYPGKLVWLWTINTAPGDSGSALYAPSGDYYCTLSYTITDSDVLGFQVIACFPPKFTKEQLKGII